MDYCTLFPEGWWAHCCQAHDSNYADQIGKALADALLRECVAGSLPEVVAQHPWLVSVAGSVSGLVGTVMVIGVWLFGRGFYRRAAGS